MVLAAPRPTLRTREARALRRVASRGLSALLLLALASGAGCQRPAPAVAVGAPVGEAAARVRHAGVGAFEDPTVGNPRLVPEHIDPGALSDAAPDGALRGVVAGYRVLVASDGAVRVSEDRLSAVPASSLAIPARLGGGHLFVVGTTVLRADSWLSEARPVYAARAPIQRVFAGLDRVYLRTARGHVAIDAATGATRDLGPYPPGPELFAYGATDGWRAAALSNLSGLVATGDAGATWRRVEAGFQVRDVTLTPLGKLVVTGVERGRAVAAELREHDELVRVAPDAPSGAALRRGSARSDSGGGRPSARPEVRVFGPRPLLAAIEDGWPLTDGVALVARDGALGRVRLSDGALVEAVPDAFPLSPARCRGVSLTRPAAKGAFGFVCGEPRGRTDLYAYNPLAGRLVLLRRFDSPRVVLSSGNGALAVRGACGVDVVDPPKQQTYCILDHGDRFREVRVRGDVGSERVAVLANRSVAILSPPVASVASGGELGTARLTLLDARGEAKTVALSFPRLDANVARALRFGVWLDPVEERRPGVLGAWVDAGGSVVGLEIGVDGAVKVGQHVREAGFPTVSGRYGLGYTNARRLYETSDGGMTWRSEEVPEPLVPLAKVASRAVGPIGAAAAGWLRVGWGVGSNATGESKSPHVEEVPARATSPLSLECDALAPSPSLPAASGAPKPRVPPAHSGPMVRPQPLHGLLSSSYGGSTAAVRELTPFFATAPPKVREGEHAALNTAVFESLSQLPRSRALAHVYVWGPQTPTREPDATTRLLVRWLSPFDGYADVHSTAPTPLPASLLEAMRAPTPSFSHAYTHYSTQWKVAVSDDGRHALLASRLGGVGLRLWELESGRGPIEVRSADGADVPELESVVRVEGRWVIAVARSGTAVDPDAGSDLLVIDGGVARRLARVPRAGTGARRVGRLARRTDGRAVGYVLEASGAASRGSPERWVVAVDLETGAVGGPTLLGDPEYADVALGACVGDEPGYVLEVPLSAGLRIRLGGGRLATLSNALGRVRISPGRACVEAAAGNVVGDGAFVVRKGPAVAKRGGLPVGAVWGNLRYPLACSVVQ